jgi:FkbM family methyltransferase
VTWVVSAVAGRVVQRPGLATRIMRLPAFLPPGLRLPLYRSISWPLAIKYGAEAQVPVVGGSRMVVRTDDMIGRVLALSGKWEPNVTAALQNALAPGDVFLDIGAHIGYYAVVAAQLVGPRGHVYAFEPSPSSYGLLRRNIELNRLSNVTAFGVAVGATTGRGTLYEGPRQNSGLATLNPVFAAKREAPKEVAVDIRPVTSLVPQAELERVRAVKIDVEWQELEVLQSLESLLELKLPLAVFLEWTPRRADPHVGEALLEFCTAHGFELNGVRSGYSFEKLFPTRIERPELITSLPDTQADLLLRR